MGPAPAGPGSGRLCDPPRPSGPLRVPPARQRAKGARPAAMRRRQRDPRGWRWRSIRGENALIVLFGEALVLKQGLGDRMGMAVALDSLGRVATAEGRGERAAVLLGAAEGVWDVVGMSETGNPFAFAPSDRGPPAGTHAAGQAAVPRAVPPRGPGEAWTRRSDSPSTPRPTRNHPPRGWSHHR